MGVYNNVHLRNSVKESRYFNRINFRSTEQFFIRLNPGRYIEYISRYFYLAISPTMEFISSAMPRCEIKKTHSFNSVSQYDDVLLEYKDMMA